MLDPANPNKIELAGQSYAFPAKVINNQETINMYCTNTSMGKDAELCLRPSPGLTLCCTVNGATQVRALINFLDNTWYAIIDYTMYSLVIDPTTNLGALVSVGTLSHQPSGLPLRISWDVNPTQIMIVDGWYGYTYTPTTNTFALITDSNFLGTPGTVAFYDSYFIFNERNTFDMQSSAINDGTTWNALDFAAKEGKSDYIVAVASNLGDLWVMGNRSTEAWWDAATAIGFPLLKRYGTPVIQGCAAAASVVNVNNNLVWLDDRLFVVINSGYTLNQLTTEPISNIFSTYSTCADAFAYTYTDGGHQFYVLTFPTANATWVYDFNTLLWHQRVSYASNMSVGQTNPYVLPNGYPDFGIFGRHLANCHVNYNNLHVVGDYQSGNIYIMTTNAYDEAGQFIRRKRVASFITQNYEDISIGNLEIKCSVGQGTTTGQGLNPQIGLRYSCDRGYTWSYQMLQSLGTMGNYATRVRWNNLGTA